MTTAWLRSLMSLAPLACTAPEPVAQVPEWLHPAADRPPAPLSEVPGDPRWLVLPEPRECDARIAADPAAVGRTLEWLPCPKGQPGCRVLRRPPDAPTGLWGARLGGELYAGWTAAGVVMALHERGARARMTLAPLDGPPFLVLDVDSSPGGCELFIPLFAETSAALGIADGSGPDRAGAVFLAGPLRADPAWHHPAARSDATSALSLAGRSLVLTRGGILRSDPNTGTFTEVARARAPCCGVALGTSVVFIADGQLLAAVTPGAPPLVLHRPETADISALQLVGGAFYWLRAVGRATPGELDHVELWTAPATDEPARFTARKVADLDLRELPNNNDHPLIFGGGKVAVNHYHPPIQGTRVVIVDVASGAQRVWQPGPGEGARAVFVNAEELGVETSADADPQVFMRLRHDTLPELPSTPRPAPGRTPAPATNGPRTSPHAP